MIENNVCNFSFDEKLKKLFNLCNKACGIAIRSTKSSTEIAYICVVHEATKEIGSELGVKIIFGKVPMK